MDLGLRGKVAIVTGAAEGGLGDAMASRLLDEGCRVVAVDRDRERTEALVRRLEPAGEILGVIADLSAPDCGETVVARALDAYGGVDVLVNNAGIYPSHAWDAYSVDEWDATLDTNLRAMWLLAKAAVPSMAERGGGSIVNIGSITMLIGMANILPYVASKGGVIGLTRALAREVGPLNVRVNTVSPGAFPTGGERIHPDPEGYSRFVIDQQSLKRRGTPADLADVVAFMASERSSFITGQTVEVCGGWAHS
jgi:NAD(P)-dependent dehydrogenase (short-subunit alcohol dehydrogenase family)